MKCNKFQWPSTVPIILLVASKSFGQVYTDKACRAKNAAKPKDMRLKVEKQLYALPICKAAAQKGYKFTPFCRSFCKLFLADF